MPFFGNRYKQINQKSTTFPFTYLGKYVTQSSKCTTVLEDLEAAQGLLYLTGLSTFQNYRNSTLYHNHKFDLLAFEDIQLYIK